VSREWLQAGRKKGGRKKGGRKKGEVGRRMRKEEVQGCEPGGNGDAFEAGVASTGVDTRRGADFVLGGSGGVWFGGAGERGLGGVVFEGGVAVEAMRLKS